MAGFGEEPGAGASATFGESDDFRLEPIICGDTGEAGPDDCPLGLATGVSTGVFNCVVESPLSASSVDSADGSSDAVGSFSTMVHRFSGGVDMVMMGFVSLVDMRDGSGMLFSIVRSR